MDTMDRTDGNAGEEAPHLTAYDEMMQTKELLMLKTMLPYMERSRQLQLLMIIQFLEVQHTRQILDHGGGELSACAVPEGTDRRSAMLSDMRRFCSPREQETIDNLLNILCIVDNYDLFFS